MRVDLVAHARDRPGEPGLGGVVNGHEDGEPGPEQRRVRADLAAVSLRQCAAAAPPLRICETLRIAADELLENRWDPPCAQGPEQLSQGRGNDPGLAQATPEQWKGETGRGLQAGHGVEANLRDRKST